MQVLPSKIYEPSLFNVIFNKIKRILDFKIKAAQLIGRRNRLAISPTDRLLMMITLLAVSSLSSQTQPAAAMRTSTTQFLKPAIILIVLAFFTLMSGCDQQSPEPLSQSTEDLQKQILNDDELQAQLDLLNGEVLANLEAAYEKRDEPGSLYQRLQERSAQQAGKNAQEPDPELKKLFYELHGTTEEEYERQLESTINTIFQRYPQMNEIGEEEGKKLLFPIFAKSFGLEGEWLDPEFEPEKEFGHGKKSRDDDPIGQAKCPFGWQYDLEACLDYARNEFLADQAEILAQFAWAIAACQLTPLHLRLACRGVAWGARWTAIGFATARYERASRHCNRMFEDCGCNSPGRRCPGIQK